MQHVNLYANRGGVAPASGAREAKQLPSKQQKSPTRGDKTKWFEIQDLQ